MKLDKIDLKLKIIINKNKSILKAKVNYQNKNIEKKS